MGGENLAEIQFNNCELPLENLIISEDGFRKLLNAFNTQRCLNPSVSLGLAEGAFEEAVKYARERTAFGRPIGEFQAHAPQARRDVPRHRGEPLAPLSRVPRRRTRSPTPTWRRSRRSP